MAIFIPDSCLRFREIEISWAISNYVVNIKKHSLNTHSKFMTDLNQIFLKPEVGTQKIMRDPSIAQGPDGVFHLVWTCSWKGDNGFGYAGSKDLKNWSEQKFIPVMQKEPTTVNVWAPEIFF